MKNNLFYPTLNRRSNYLTRANGEFYADYKQYRTEIAEDCAYRCVYCDITNAENGYDNMVLDHFRPQKHFPDLHNDPNNLVLSCPKCNRLKSHHWPADVLTNNTHNGSVGFIDPFNDVLLKYFSVEYNGELKALQPPANYVVELLLLNRQSRKLVRHLRWIKHEIDCTIEQIYTSFKKRYNDWKEGKLSKDEFVAFCEDHEIKLKYIRLLNSESTLLQSVTDKLMPVI